MKQSTGSIQELELPIIRTTALIMIIGSLLSIFINEVLGLDRSLVILCVSGVFVFFLIYLGSFRVHLFPIVKSAILIVTLVYLDMGWRYNYGVSSAIIAFFAIWALFAAVLLQKLEMIFWLIIFVINASFLIWIELENPGLLGDYPSKEAAIWDAFFTMLIAVLLLTVIIRHTRNKYQKQYLKAKHADDLKTAFLANFSHEIRTPLNSILGFSDLLLDPEERENLDERLQVIHSNSEYLLKLIEDILDLARIESGQLTIHNERFDISILLRKLCEEYKTKIDLRPDNEVDLICQIPETPVYIKTDTRRVEQVVRNLLENAVKFTAQGYIKILLGQSDGWVVVSIQDTGIGIKDDYIKQVFERFVKIGQNLSNNQRGVGLGLAVSKHLIEKLEGEISVHSQPGQGSTFSFSLPQVNLNNS